MFVYIGMRSLFIFSVLCFTFVCSRRLSYYGWPTYFYMLSKKLFLVLFHFLILILRRKNLPIPMDNDLNGIVNIEQMGDYKRHFAITISPSERAILRDEKCFPEQEWTF